MKVVLLKGGVSLEREVSLMSADLISDAILDLGHDVHQIDVTDDIEALTCEIKRINPEIIFNGLYGTFGEDGRVQSILDMLKIPYTHSSAISSSMAMHKYFSRMIFENAGINVPKSKLMTRQEYLKSKLDLPYVVKPVANGSSFGVRIVLDEKTNDEVKKDWNFEHALIEEYLKGREITVGILNDKILGTLEILYDTQYYDFSAKYVDGVAKHLSPAPLSEAEETEVSNIALKAHNLLMCNCLSRSDFIFANNKFYLLEVNSQPGMAPISLIPDMVKAKGIPYKEIINQILMSAKYHV